MLYLDNILSYIIPIVLLILNLILDELWLIHLGPIILLLVLRCFILHVNVYIITIIITFIFIGVTKW